MLLLSTPGVFVGADRFGRRWRQVKVLANSFWKRWISEYLPMLQLRQKWRKEVRNVKVNDLVLLVDSGCPRGRWPIAIVEEVLPDEHGTVRASSYCSNQQWKVQEGYTKVVHVRRDEDRR